MKTALIFVAMLAFALADSVRADDTHAVAGPFDDEPEIVISAPRSSRVVAAPVTQHEVAQTPDEILTTGRATTVIRSEEIERAGARQVLEVLRDVPGLHVVQTGSYGGTTSVFARGGEAGYNLVLIDGVKVNAPGGSYNFNALPTDNIDRIEIVKGPAAFALGGDGASSVIQIFTKRGKGPPRYTLAAEAGTFSTFSEDISGLGTTGPAGWSFSASQFNTAGHLPINNDYARTAASGRIDLPLSDRTDAQFTINHYSDKFEVATDAGGDLLPPFFLDPDGGTRTTSTAMGARVERQLRENWKVGAALENFLGTSFNRDPMDTPADVSPFFSEQETRRQRAHIRTDFTWMGWDFGFGGEMEREEAHGISVSGTTAQATTTHIGRINRAGFLTVGGDLVKNLRLSTGVRLDDNTRLDREISWSAGLQYLHEPSGVTFRASGGQGFKYPLLTQVASSSPTFLPNPDLKGEHENSGELGFDLPLLENNRLIFSATGFLAHTKDMIGNVTVAPGVSSPKNLGQAHRIGSELSLGWNITPRWRLAGNYTYVKTKTTDAGPIANNTAELGQELLRRPRNSGGATLAYNGERMRGEVNVNAVGRAIDRDFANNQFGRASFRVPLPGYAKVDASLEYDVTKRLTLTAAGTNILGKDYQEVYGFSSPPAAWRGGLKWNF